MNDATSDLVRKLHASDLRLAMAVTGGGSLAISHLLTVPGASRTVLECVVPYSGQALANYLGAAPEKACCPATARAMAMAAFQRALVMTPSKATIAATDKAVSDGRPIGLGCTASLATDRPKRGPHRAHVALQTADSTLRLELPLLKGARSRRDEESLLADVLINVLSEAAGLTERLSVTWLLGETPTRHRTEARPGWRELIIGTRRAVGLNTDADTTPKLVFPGAFNPRHEGHRRMAAIAQERAGDTVAHEISILNVDKPPLDYEEMDRRAAQFLRHEPLWFTRAATFLEKAALFPGATFIVGTDTLLRIGQMRYYGNQAELQKALAQIADRGCRFLVFCRAADGRVQTLDDLELPPALRALCQEVPASEFRMDISSTRIRQTLHHDQE